MPLRAFWTCRHLWSSSFSYVDWTSICLMTIAALSLVAMSCQLLGGNERTGYCKNDAFMPTGTKSLGCSPFPLCFSFLVLPSLEDSKTVSKSFASEKWGASVYLEERSLEKFSANQTNVYICSYRACCGQGKTMVHAGARWCLYIGTGCPYLSRYPFSKRRQTNRAVALEWKDTIGSKWYHLL